MLPLLAVMDVIGVRAFFCAADWALLRWWLLAGLAGTAALVLAPLAPVGVWVGLHIVRRIHSRWFYGLLYAGMAITGLKLVGDSWLA
ncbi:MAG: hypothetical protein ACUVVU_06235 [Tepidimonas sp.]|uniref:hypothetical protein n=1 Tax=Tepidimonas sp. TaxID=2002775 RepID=UPI004055329C